MQKAEIYLDRYLRVAHTARVRPLDLNAEDLGFLREWQSERGGSEYDDAIERRARLQTPPVPARTALPPVCPWPTESDKADLDRFFDRNRREPAALIWIHSLLDAVQAVNQFVHKLQARVGALEEQPRNEARGATDPSLPPYRTAVMVTRSVAPSDAHDDAAALVAQLAELKARVGKLEQRAATTSVAWEGVWRSGQTYAPGGLVTDHGSLWLALQNTELRPGSPMASHDWRLIVKAGNFGRRPLEDQ